MASCQQILLQRLFREIVSTESFSQIVMVQAPYFTLEKHFQ